MNKFARLEQARRESSAIGSIDLLLAYRLFYGEPNEAATRYLVEVERVKLILSRQAAAVAIATAHAFAPNTEEEDGED